MTALDNLTTQLGETREIVAEHGARITNVESQGKSNGEKLDRLLYWLLGVLAACVGNLLLQLLKKG